jgi:hypothetical protein
VTPAKLALIAGAGAVAAVAWLIGALLGFDSFAFAWTVHFMMMAWMAAALDVLQPCLASSWYRVRRWEPPIYRRLGVWQFMRLLRRIGWERAMRGKQPFDGSRSALPALERRTRLSEFGHTILAVAGTVLALVAAAVGAWQSFVWFLVLNVVLHGYPVLLQRALRHRLQRIRHTWTRFVV